MNVAKPHTQYSLSEWLYTIEHRSSKQEIRLGLARIRSVAQSMQLLSSRCVVIAVGGTNGKGSTVAMLEAIYSAAGYCVGAYTSPHLLHFNERIRVQQQNISDTALCEAFCAVETARGETELTYFETTTLAALWYFQQQPLDVMILEVGVGGRLDATNIMDSDLAIISTVDYDHQEFLGNTLDAIGFEKAGILRPHKILVYADTHMPFSVLQQAKQNDVKIRQLQHDYFYTTRENQFELTITDGEHFVLPKPNLHLHAAASGIVAAHSLQDKLPILKANVEEACRKVKIAGRTQVFYDTIRTVFDVSHNPQSVSFLVEKLKTLEIKGKVHAVFSGLVDKDLYGMIQPMHTYVNHWYCAELACKRRASETQLRFIFNQVSSTMDLQFYPSISKAYQAAKMNAKEGDWVIVFGSFYVVSAVILETPGLEYALHNQKTEGFVWNG